MKEDTILKVLPWDVRSIIQKEKLEFEYLQEIRLREGKPLIFLYHDTEVIPGAKARRPYLVTKDNPTLCPPSIVINPCRMEQADCHDYFCSHFTFGLSG